MPGKKPLSSMSPTMVFWSAEAGTLGPLILVLGASGGPKIISAVVQIFANMMLLGMPLFESIIHPRFHDQLIYHDAAVATVEDTVLEQGPSINVTQRTRNALLSRGHALLDVDYEGTVQAIAIDLETKELTAACDVRKGGSPAGY
jgi:gamma-glutamyltranspeptidase